MTNGQDLSAIRQGLKGKLATCLVDSTDGGFHFESLNLGLVKFEGLKDSIPLQIGGLPHAPPGAPRYRPFLHL
ncbi:MAG: hypothetical protein E4H27_00240 [Anaerolineales bacterium]|nr:MAG: hypothetical protein E4H27_00240 [Anaerolineales bacterium]